MIPRWFHPLHVASLGSILETIGTQLFSLSIVAISVPPDGALFRPRAAGVAECRARGPANGGSVWYLLRALWGGAEGI